MNYNLSVIIFTEKIVRIKEFLQELKTSDIKTEKKVIIVARIRHCPEHWHFICFYVKLLSVYNKHMKSFCNRTTDFNS